MMENIKINRNDMLKKSEHKIIKKIKHDIKAHTSLHACR